MLDLFSGRRFWIRFCGTLKSRVYRDQEYYTLKENIITPFRFLNKYVFILALRNLYGFKITKYNILYIFIL